MLPGPGIVRLPPAVVNRRRRRNSGESRILASRVTDGSVAATVLMAASVAAGILAERVGFEPTWGVMPPTDFESVPL